jgi:hypothetical protein
MFTDPVALIDQTIDNLEILSVLFEDETDERTHVKADLTPAARRCLDAQQVIVLLLPKLRAARAAQTARYSPPICINCD